MRCVGKIVESSHNRDVVLYKMIGFVLADYSIISAKEVDDYLEAFLPLIRYCKDENGADFKRMPV